MSERFQLSKSLAERLVAGLDDIAESLDVLLLLAEQRRHLGGVVAVMLVDDTDRTDDCTTAETEVVAALARVFLAVQRVRRAQCYVVTFHRLTKKHSNNILTYSSRHNSVKTTKTTALNLQDLKMTDQKRSKTGKCSTMGCGAFRNLKKGARYAHRYTFSKKIA